MYADDEIQAAVDVLRSGRVNYWTGSEGRQFESEFARAIGAEHAVFVSNGTVALELAIASLGLPPGSEIVTTPRTFLATTSAIVANGHKPIFADLDPESGNITPESVAAVMSDRTAAIVVVHLAGWPADMVGFRALAGSAGVRLVEDCAQAHGGGIGGRSLGTFSDVAAWSFCQDKIISTAGEGGMITTDDDALWRESWSRKDHGKSWEAVYERDHAPGFRWLHEGPGTNGRGTEVQAAIGRLQLAKLPEWTAIRQRNATALAAALSGVPGLAIPMPAEGLTHAFYRLNGYLDVSAFRTGWNRNRVIGELASRFGVTVQTGACSEIYREVALSAAGLAPDHPLPVAQRMTSSSLAFLVDPTVDEAELDRVARSVREVVGEAMR